MLISGHQFIDLFFTCPNMQITSFLVRLIWTKLLGSLKSHTKKKKEGCVSSLLQSYRYHHSSKHFKNSADGVTSLTPIWPQPNRIETSRTKQKKKKSICVACVSEWMIEQRLLMPSRTTHRSHSLSTRCTPSPLAISFQPPHILYTHISFFDRRSAYTAVLAHERTCSVVAAAAAARQHNRNTHTYT